MAEEAIPLTVKLLWGFGSPILESLLKGSVSLFLSGSPGTGKSSFRLALKNASKEQMGEITRTSLGERENISYLPNPNKELIVPLKCYDFGGDKEYAIRRRHELLQTKPLGIMFFLDHRDTRTEIGKALSPNLKRETVDAYIKDNRALLGSISLERMEEHRGSLRELIDNLTAHQQLRRKIKTIVPIVNKYDFWQDYHHLNDFQDYFKDELIALDQLQIRITQYVACSMYERLGLTEAMNLLLSNVGRELSLGSFKFQVNIPFVK